MSRLYEDIFSAEHVQNLYDGIFFGYVNDPSLNLPFRYDCIPLNGTEKPDCTPDAEVYTSARFGVFIDPTVPVLFQTAVLVPESPAPLTEEEVCSLVQNLKLTVEDENQAVTKDARLISHNGLSRYFRTLNILQGLPIAVISGWKKEQRSLGGENICLHYPGIAHPGSVLGLLQTIAERNVKLLQAEEAIPVSVASVSDGTTDFTGRSDYYRYVHSL